MNTSRIERFVRLGAAALTAIILWAAFPPRGEAYGIFFALAPLLAATRRARPRAAAGWWGGAGFAFWFATLGWMPALCHNNGPWPLVVLGWCALATVCAGYFALFGFLNAVLWCRADAWADARSPVVRAVAAPLGEAALWAGVEWLRATLFTGFAWNFLGTAVGAYPAFAAPACLGGVYFVSALVVLANGVFATLATRAVRPVRTPRGARFLETALPLAVVAGALAAARPTAPTAPIARTLRVALVQRNAPCVFSQRDAEDPYRAFADLIDTTALARPDLIVLPESALAEFGTARSDRARQAALHFAHRAGGAAVIGGADDTCFTNGARRTYNAAAYYAPYVTNALVDVYHKQHLVPFGEYIFFDKWITPLQRLSPIGVSLYPGEPKLFDLEGIRLAPLICFEDTDPALARRAAAMGADALVLITNDSWFSGSCEPEQHAWQAVLRAIETGLPVLRAANSGVTGLIPPSGRARWLTDGAGRVLVDRPGCQVESLAIVARAATTPYVRFGDLPLLAAALAALVFLAAPTPRARNPRP